MADGGFTEEELLALMMAETVLAYDDAAELSAYLFEESMAVRAALVESQYNMLIQQFRGEMSAEVLANARALAEKAADSLQRSFIESQLKTIGNTIAEGLKAGKNSLDIAKDLKMVDVLDNPRAARLRKYEESLDALGLTEADKAKRLAKFKEKLLKERRETIARTEARRAVAEADRAAAIATGAKWHVWQTTGDNRVSSECQANEAQGPIPVGESFTGGAASPPQHPRCRCSVSYIRDPRFLDDAKRRAEQRAAATEAAQKLEEVL